MGPPPGGTDYQPPPGPDYAAIVNGYLQRLTQPMPIPHAPGLSGLQALAVEMNPQRRTELLNTFNAPYREQMAQFQFDQGRQGQAAGLAAKMETAQAQDRYKSEVLRGTQAYRGFMGRQSERRTAATEKRTQAYVNRAGKGAGPKDWAGEIARLDKEIESAGRDVIAGQSRGAQMGLTLGSGPEGKAAQAAISGPMQDAQQRYAKLNELRQRIQKVTSAPEFQQSPRQFQNRVIERLMTTYGLAPDQGSAVGPPPADLEDEDLADAD